MKIAVLVHSETGHTLKFGRLIARELSERGHSVDLVQLKTDVPVGRATVRQAPRFAITNCPDCSAYDAVLVGGPVYGFSASPVSIACISKLSGISGKPFLPFVTMGFPLPGMGGSQAIALMSDTARKAGAKVLPGKMAGKLFRRQDRLMEAAAASIPSMLEAIV